MSSSGYGPSNAPNRSTSRFVPSNHSSYASDRKIAGMLRFFWENEIGGRDFKTVPIGQYALTLRIELDADGQLIDTAIASTSGNETLDGLALRAVRGAAPISPIAE